MIQYKILFFVGFAFLWAWASWIIGLTYLSKGINGTTINQYLTFFFIGVYAPSVSAILTTLYFNGLSETKTLLKKLFIWKVGLKNYLYVIVLPLIFVALAIGLYAVFLGNVGSFDKSGFSSIHKVLWAGLFAGPLAEELGWRGFLLPEFQKKYTPVKSATIIGILWFCWHIPLFWAPFGALVSADNFTILPTLTFLIMVISLSWIGTWLVNNSKGSVLVAILFHLSINASLALLFFPKLNPVFKQVLFLSSIPMILFSIYIGIKTKLNNTTGNNIDETPR